MQSITVHELRAREDVPLIDVREADEFAAGHVPGAVNLPMSTLGDHLDELPDGRVRRDLPVGGRSAPVVAGARGARLRRHERRGRHRRVGGRGLPDRALTRPIAPLVR